MQSPVRVAAALLIFLVTVSGCGNGTTPHRPSEKPVTPAVALKSAQDRLREDDTGSFTATSYVDGRAVTADEGAYSLGDERFIIHREMHVPDQTMGMEVRVLGKVMFMQMKEWPRPMRGCWLKYTGEDLAAVTGTGSVIGGAPQPVGAVELAQNPSWSSRRAHQLRVSVPVTLAMQLVGISARIYTQLRDVESVLAEATLTLDADRPAALEISGDDVASALEESEAQISGAVLSALRVMSSRADFRTADAVSVSVPRAELVVSGDAKGSAATCH